MRSLAIGFLSGTFLLQHSAELPHARIALAALAALLACALVRGRIARALLVVAAGAFLGFGYAAWRAEGRMADELPVAREGADVEVVGLVAELPQVRERATRFVFHVERVATAGAIVPGRIALSWYPQSSPSGRIDPPALLPGERWKLTVRLKRIRGLANPHAFDFEPWALERGLRASGYVRVRPAAQRMEALVEGWPQTLHRWRGQLRDDVRAALADAPLAGVVVALALGDQEAIPAAQWDTFWRTGVGHLMSISGLHITLLAGLAFAIVFRTWARIPVLALRIPARKAAIVAGTAVALAYALMTGFAVPAQRTVVMLAVLAACVAGDRRAPASSALAAALLAVLVADPWAVLSGGFWLSFGAVSAIGYAMASRAPAPGRLRAAAVEQLAVGLVMLPLVLALFGEYSLVSPAANALAIPVVSAIVVPLAITGAFFGLEPALAAAHAALSWLMPVLERLAASPYAMLETHAPPAWAVASALAGCAWLLAPRGVPLRSLGSIWMLPLFVVAAPRPAWGEAWIDVLDVGNGLAVVVRTAGHALVYDAGPAWGEESDSGERIVVPYLRGEGLARLDALVVSHADEDHAGGAISVAAMRAPAWLLSSLPAGDAIHGLVARSTRCAAGQSWSWDGVEFRILHPPQGVSSMRPNDGSCVLRVATGGGAALLTGDIEARAERSLLARESELDADVLLVPHHGSRSSSTPEFLEAVAPRAALVAAGYRNRFRHPHPAVLARYAARRIPVWRTDRDGALRAVLPAESGRLAAVQPLVRTVRYWSDRRER